MVDVRPIHMVCNDPAPAGINPGHRRRAVHHRRAGINGVVIAKSDSLARELPERGRVLFADKSGRIPSQTITTTCRSGLVDPAATADAQRSQKSNEMIRRICE